MTSSTLVPPYGQQSVLQIAKVVASRGRWSETPVASIWRFGIKASLSAAVRAVADWHLTDIPARPPDVCSWGYGGHGQYGPPCRLMTQSGHRAAWARNGPAANDPERTSSGVFRHAHLSPTMPF